MTQFMKVDTTEDLEVAIAEFGLPLLLKSRRNSYDGYGNFVVRNREDIPAAMAKLGGSNLYAEKFVDFTTELSVMVSVHADVKDSEKMTVAHFPVTQTFHTENICTMTLTPASISSSAEKLAIDISTKAALCFGSPGIFGVEMFLTCIF